jgi:hypothetical protein
MRKGSKAPEVVVSLVHKLHAWQKRQSDTKYSVPLSTGIPAPNSIVLAGPGSTTHCNERLVLLLSVFY